MKEDLIENIKKEAQVLLSLAQKINNHTYFLPVSIGEISIDTTEIGDHVDLLKELINKF